jgi:putative membrane protein
MKELNSERLRTELARDRDELARNRTRLANRRTFLAWCRTALAFMTFGFLLEKVDAFVTYQRSDVPVRVITDLGLLGKSAFVGGPILVAFAAWRYFKLEKAMGFEPGDLYAVPELFLFGVIMASAVIYLFL